MIAVIYCSLTGRMTPVDGIASEIRALADEMAKAVPGHSVLVLEPVYSAKVREPHPEELETVG